MFVSILFFITKRAIRLQLYQNGALPPLHCGFVLPYHDKMCVIHSASLWLLIN
jgi:hypothetical protein